MRPTTNRTSSSSTPLKGLAQDELPVLRGDPGHVISESANHALPLARFDLFSALPSFDDSLLYKVLGTVRTTYVATFSAASMTTVLGNRHEYRTLLRSLWPHHSQFVRSPTSKKDTARLYG